MKKLLNKLNQKPKLKKCLKILCIIGIVLSVGFNLLIISVAIANGYKNQTYHKASAEEYGVVEKYYSFKVGNYAYLNYSDLSNSLVAHNLLDYIHDYYDIGVYQHGGNYTINLSQSNYIVDMDTGYTNGTLEPNNMTDLLEFDSISVSYTLGGGGGKYDTLLLQLYDIGNNTYNTLRIFFRRYIQLNGDFTGEMLVMKNNSNQWLPYDPAWIYRTYCSIVNNRERIPLFLQIIGPIENGAQDYISGYDNGFKLGDQLGYDRGYQEGLNAYDGETGLSNSPFDLIASAFNSVASVLNINILPNLSLGTLLFIPIIVSVIIVIVKMIKG